MAFDHQGHFCIYTQEDGMIDEGNYAESEENLYELKGVSGYYGYVITTKNGVYYSSEDGRIDFLPRLHDTSIFVGDWAQEWKHWPEGPYQVS